MLPGTDFSAHSRFRLWEMHFWGDFVEKTVRPNIFLCYGGGGCLDGDNDRHAGGVAEQPEQL